MEYNSVMKMKKCRHCSEEILYTAQVCRYCNKKQEKNNIILNMIGLGVLVWIVWGVYQQGYLDNLFNQFRDGHTFDSIEEATCNELKDTAIGRELSNADGDTWEVMGVRNIEEISRNANELVCSGEVLTKGNWSIIMITLSDWDGEIFLQWQAY